MFPLFSWLTAVFLVICVSSALGIAMMVGAGLWGAVWPEDERAATRLVFAGMGLILAGATAGIILVDMSH